MHTDDFSKMAI